MIAPVLKVSVVIPVYAAAKWVSQAVESAIAQPETGEVILVEDGSPDDSLVICERLADAYARVRVLQHPGGVNLGAGPSRNLGIEHAREELIAFLDADDYYLPGRFSRACQLFAADSDLDGVYETIAARFEDEAARVKWFRDKDRELYGPMRAVPPEQLFEQLVRGEMRCFSTIGLSLRRRVFSRAGLFSAHATDQDIIIWCKLAARGRLVAGRLDEPVAIYRIHEHNRSFHEPEAAHLIRRERWEHLAVWARREGLETRAHRLLFGELLKSTAAIHSLTLHTPARLVANLAYLLGLTRGYPEGFVVADLPPYLRRALAIRMPWRRRTA